MNCLQFAAGDQNYKLLRQCNCLINAKVVPPMFHMLAHLRQYTISLFCKLDDIEERQFFDALTVEIGNLFHHLVAVIA